MYKIDLHTHSCASPDGALKAKHYRDLLGRGVLDYIAVTDHDSISNAQKLREDIGDRIIIGEEISTIDGEIIGLFLSKVIHPGLSLLQSIKEIHDQDGIVYVPHPFETVRKGLSLDSLNEVAKLVDIIEVYNGRAIFQNHSSKSIEWSKINAIPGAASSDAHGVHGWGRTFSIISKQPNNSNLGELLKNAEYKTKKVGVRGVLYPKYNRLRKRYKHD
jgi:predicted metal-dependent phosphoesterase TrpH